MKVHVLEGGTISGGVHDGQQRKGSGEGSWDQLIQGTVGQAESFALVL